MQALSLRSARAGGVRGWRGLVGRVVIAAVTAIAGMATVAVPPASAAMSLDQFVAESQGKEWANVQGTYSGECVSLISQYLFKVYDISTGKWGNAVDYRAGGTGGNQLASRGFSWSGDQAFQDGDILVWGDGASTGPEGHVAIWYHGQLFDQNWAGHRYAAFHGFFSSGYLGHWRKATGNPFGSGVDSVTSPANGKIRVTGWAIDPDVKASAIAVHIYVGGAAGSGAPGFAYTADASRPDVGAAFPGAGDNHGFEVTIDIGKGGTLPVYVYAINAGGTPGSNMQIGSKTVAVGNPVPVGAFDTATSPTPGRIRVTGWAFDPDAKTQSLRIHAYVGAPVGAAGAEFHDLGVANVERLDVANAYPGVGSHQGFNVAFNTTKIGNVPVYLYAINAPGTSGFNPQIGARTVAVKDPNPFGAFDSATTPYGGRVDISGWAIDPNAPTAPAAIHVYIGGPAGSPDAEFHSITANKSREDVAKVYPGTGTSHGYSASIQTAKRGPQNVFVYAINSGPGQNQLLGSRNVSVASPLPISNSALPTMSGTRRVGYTLTARPGTWMPGSLTFQYQWFRGATAIKGATAKTYKLPASARGYKVRVRVTASRLGYTTLARYSAYTAAIS